jgi:hypothetical protein
MSRETGVFLFGKEAVSSFEMGVLNWIKSSYSHGIVMGEGRIFLMRNPTPRY